MGNSLMDRARSCLDDEQFEAFAMMRERNPNLLPLYELRPDSPLSADLAEDITEKTFSFTVVDFETTGIDTRVDRPIEIGMVRVSVCGATRRIIAVEDVYNALNDPGMPIPLEATKVNGITDEMVAGKSFDLNRITSICKASHFLVAHNANFDRKVWDLAFPKLNGKGWACSIQGIDWSGLGISSSKLEYITYQLGFFYAAHRADMDCRAVAHALFCQVELEGEKFLPMLQLIDSMKAVTCRIWPTSSEFDSKDVMKARGYRWQADEKSVLPKSWYIEVPEAEVDNEIAWLRDNVRFRAYKPTIGVETLTARVRFSDRKGDWVERPLHEESA